MARFGQRVSRGEEGARSGGPAIRGGGVEAEGALLLRLPGGALAGQPNSVDGVGLFRVLKGIS